MYFIKDKIADRLSCISILFAQKILQKDFYLTAIFYYTVFPVSYYENFLNVPFFISRNGKIVFARATMSYSLLIRGTLMNIVHCNSLSEYSIFFMLY